MYLCCVEVQRIRTILFGMQSSSVSFLPEIQSIMYAMGDCRRPLLESAKLIEESLLHEMRQYIRQAQTLAEQRNEEWFNGEDLIFLLRNDRTMLRRLINTLKVTDLKSRVKMQTTKGENEEDDDIIDDSGDLGSKSTSKRIKFMETVLEKLDPTGDLSTLLDDNGEDCVKRERLMRAAAYVASVDTGEYMRFTEARQVSFLSKQQNNRRFREWLFGPANDGNNPVVVAAEDENFFADFKPSMITMEILNFLAHETMATIMDCALFVKRECNVVQYAGDQTNDVVRLRPQTTSVVGGSATMKSNGNTFGGDLLSPQTTPTEKCPRNSQQFALLLAQRVRNKSQASQNNVISYNCLTNVAVQPWEIREAIRRLRYYNNSGRSAFLLFGCNNFSSGLLAK